MASSSFGGFGKPAAAPAPGATAPARPGLPTPGARPAPAPAAGLTPPKPAVAGPGPAAPARAPIPAARIPAGAPGVGLPRPGLPTPAAKAPAGPSAAELAARKAAAEAAQAEADEQARAVAEAEAAQQAEQDRVNEEARLAEEAAAQQAAAQPAAPAPAAAAPRRTRAKSSLSLAQPTAPAPAPEPAPAPTAEIPQAAGVGGDEDAEDTAIVLSGTFDLPAFGQVTGELTSRDVKLPRLALVHPVGKLAESFPRNAGSFVLNKEALLTDPDSPEWASLNLTILGLTKFYRENVKYGSDILPRQFSTLAEVREAGGWIDWRDGKDPQTGLNTRIKPPFSEAALVIVAIECPAGWVGSEGEELFAYVAPDGTRRTLAIWQLVGSSYNTAGKKIITEAGSTLKTHGLPRGKWLLTAKQVKKGDNMVWEPQLARSGLHSPEVLHHLKEIMGAVDEADLTPGTEA